MMKNLLLAAVMLLFFPLLAFSVQGAPLPSENKIISQAEGSIKYADGNVSYKDANIKYIGRWVEQSDAMQGYWEGYVEVAFTGTSVILNASSSGKAAIILDDKTPMEMSNLSGTLNLATTPLAEGTHTLRLVADAQNSLLRFKGITIDKGASTVPAQKKPLIEFIGDSITEGYIGDEITGKYANSIISTYSYLAGDLLKFDHNTVAYGGIAVVDGNGQFPQGMGVHYFNTGELSVANNSTWDTSKSTPDYIVINMGTNDKDNDMNFIPIYTKFLTDLRSKYPNAILFAMEPFIGRHATDIQTAVKSKNKAGDSKIVYMDTTGWAKETTDGLHPTKSAHANAAEKLAEFITGYLHPESVTPSPLPTPLPTYLPTRTPPAPPTGSDQTSAPTAPPESFLGSGKGYWVGGLVLVAALTAAAGFFTIKRKQKKQQSE